MGNTFKIIALYKAKVETTEKLNGMGENQ